MKVNENNGRCKNICNNSNDVPKEETASISALEPNLIVSNPDIDLSPEKESEPNTQEQCNASMLTIVDTGATHNFLCPNALVNAPMVNL